MGAFRLRAYTRLRCLKIDKCISDTVELFLLAATRYNKSVHSVIYKRPVDEIQESAGHSQKQIAEKIKKAQGALRTRKNVSRKNRVFEVGKKFLVKTNRRMAINSRLYVKRRPTSGHGYHGHH